jgi:hypothetical protein
MSPRAACRLELLGFTQVYDYVAGKADWLAHGLPTEGEQAQIPRAKDVLRRDAVTARPEEPVGLVAARVAGSPYGFALVVTPDSTCWVGSARPCWPVTLRHGRSKCWRPAPPPSGSYQDDARFQPPPDYGSGGSPAWCHGRSRRSRLRGLIGRGRTHGL